MFQKKFKNVCREFQKKMGDSVPEWFIDYLIETRSGIQPETTRRSVKIEAWKGHSFEEIESYLHSLHISSAGMLFNSMLSEDTGYVMAHQCGCGDCFYPGEVRIDVPDARFLQRDFEAHVKQQQLQLGLVA
jgi:hypothetical protein